MKQVYGYPQAIYGTNNYVGEPANSILSTETSLHGWNTRAMSSNINGVAVSSEGSITGAAAQMPCLNELPNINNGSFVNRNEKINHYVFSSHFISKKW